MKKVPLKGPEQPDTNEPLDYAARITECLHAPANGQSTNYEEMRVVMPLLDKLAAAEGEDFILLEDAEHEIISTRLKNAPFTINHPAVFQMITEVVEAEDAPVELVKDANTT